MARTDKQRTGDAAEDDVARRLEADGWTILGRNVRMGRYELDLVAVDPGPPRALVVIEVRWRRTRDFGLPEETVDHRKRTRIRAGAYGLLDRGTLAGASSCHDCRSDSTLWSSNQTAASATIAQPSDSPGRVRWRA